MRLVVAVVVIFLTGALSGCIHVSPLWPLKVEAQNGSIR
jgi:hypothetical protein